MIPKIIHYCWFGGSKLPQELIDYIEIWKRLMPDYEIIKWSEDNFDVMKHHYTKEAYKARKYAFVSDYCRVFVLKEYGGIYMDTDVEVIKAFTPLLNNNSFIGFEDYNKIGTSVIGATKDSIFIQEILKLYDSINFVTENGKLNLTTNVDLITNYIRKNGVNLNGETVNYEDKLTIYSKDYFSPIVFDTKKISITENTFSIHHFSQSWNPSLHFFIQRVKRVLIFCIGLKMTRKIIDKVKK
ncbi:glycosyltransferase family 32 protein [Empedobacter tilapiae]